MPKGKPSKLEIVNQKTGKTRTYEGFTAIFRSQNGQQIIHFASKEMRLKLEFQ